MRFSLHIHRWGPWRTTSLVTTVRRECKRCGGAEWRGLWMMTARQWSRVQPTKDRRPS